MKTEQEIISSAYLNMLTEAKESKFKVGDQVGISINGYTAHSYNPRDTGTVVKVNGHGHHTVEFHNTNSSDDPSKKLTKVFDADGKEKGYGSSRLVNIETHHKLVKDQNDRRERNNDIHSVLNTLNDHRTMSGHFVKIPKEHVEHIKSLLDKHVAE